MAATRPARDGTRGTGSGASPAGCGAARRDGDQLRLQLLKFRKGDMHMSSATATSTRENVLYEKKGAIAYVTLNRPKVLNALNKATIAELSEVFSEARDDAARARRDLDRLGRQGVRRRRGHRRDGQRHADRGRGQDATGAAPHDGHRESRQAGDRGRQRLRLGRRLRAGDGLHDPTGRRYGQVRPAGGDDRHHPGLRGNATPAAAGRQGTARCS